MSQCGFFIVNKNMIADTQPLLEAYQAVQRQDVLSTDPKALHNQIGDLRDEAQDIMVKLVRLQPYHPWPRLYGARLAEILNKIEHLHKIQEKTSHGTTEVQNSVK